MKKQLWLFIALVVMLFANIAQGAVQTTRTPCDHGKNERESQILRRTVGVIAPGTSGSGVLISQNEVLMSAHIVQDEKLPVIVVTCEWESIRGTVVWVDSKLDLALIEIVTNVPNHFKMRGDALPIHIGEYVWTVGQPDDLPWAISGGVVIHPNQQQTVVMPDKARREYQLIVSSAQTKKGGSGGALVDADGNLVGIVIAFQKVSSYASAQSITNFCRAYRHQSCRE